MNAIIETSNLTKIYPNGVRANDAVNFAAHAGEIHAIIGENGAGKSTLMKMLYGMERPTMGQIRLRGHAVRFDSPQQAIRRGVGMVHQNFMLIPSFTVAENIVLNAEPQRGPRADVRGAISQVTELAARYGLSIDPTARVSDIPVGMKQRVEILKALYRGAEILILDEPTAVLTPPETADLFAALRGLTASGKTILFITHKLREVMQIADRVTVLRDGRVVGELPISEADERLLARLMVGRELGSALEKPPQPRGPAILTAEGLTALASGGRAVLNGVSFALHAGEILGVAGVEGNGQTELAEVLAGLRRPAAGRVLIGDRAAPLGDPRQMRAAGVAHIPEDRLREGVALTESIADNLIVDRYDKAPFTRSGILRPRQIADHARALIGRYGVVTRGPDNPMNALSGGNMQKVIVARELSANPRVLIAAQPTRGVDIGAMAFIHSQLLAGRAAGVGILLISADLQEVLRLSDRVLVLHEGQITAVIESPQTISEDEIGLYMLGAKRMTPAEMAAQA
jgi:simple sugar transport system ATP-binding protein